MSGRAGEFIAVRLHCPCVGSNNGQHNEVRLGRYDASAPRDTEGILTGFPYRCTVIEGACTVDCGSFKKIICDTEAFDPTGEGRQNTLAHKGPSMC